VLELGGENDRSRLTIAGDTLTIQSPPPLSEVTAKLAPDGKLAPSGERARGMGTRWRVDAADAGVRRTAFWVFGTTLLD
jgi:hypothetical protein